MSNPLASTISGSAFLYRNVDKTFNGGDVGRAPAAVAMTGSLVNKVSKLDNSLGRGTQAALDSMKIGSKVVSLAGELVNPLLIAASAYRVATADDKESAAYTEAGGMSGMFAAEGLMKKESVNKFIHQEGDDLIKGSVEKLAKIIKPLDKLSAHSKNKVIKIGSSILAGLAFVGASIAGYSAGADLGTSALKQKRRLFNEPETPKTETNKDIINDKIKIPDKEEFVIES